MWQKPPAATHATSDRAVLPMSFPGTQNKASTEAFVVSEGQVADGLRVKMLVGLDGAIGPEPIDLSVG